MVGSIYSILLFCLSVALLIWGLSRPGGVYEFPFLSGVVLLCFVWFQSIGLYNDPNLPSGAVDRILLMASLCGAAAWAGYKWGRDRPLQILDWKYDKQRLLWVGVGLVIVGQFFSYLWSTLPPGMNKGTGLPVALSFFKKVQIYGIAICLLLFVSTKSKVALVAAIVPLWNKIIGAAGYGDRSGGVLLFLLIALPFWFIRGKKVYKLVVASLVIFGTFFYYSVSDYRGGEGSTIDRLSAISFVGNAGEKLRRGGEELRAGAYQMAAIEKEGDYDYGAYQWNRLVFSYVPAQLLGNSFKEFLYIPVRGKRYRRPADRDGITRGFFGYIKTPGTAVTGMATTFGSLWYLGFIFFMLVGFIMGKIYSASLSGHLFAQVAYISTIVAAMESFAHMTTWFFAKWPHIIIFLIPALMYARITPRKSPISKNRDEVGHKRVANGM